MSGPKLTRRENNLAVELLSLCDEFAEFRDRCSFLCDAFSHIASHSEDITENTANGLDCYACWLKSQVYAFNEKLHDMHGRLRSG